MEEQDKTAQPERQKAHREDCGQEVKNVGCAPIVWGFFLGIIAGAIYAGWYWG